MPGVTYACGPFLPNSILGDDDVMLAAPVANFRRELDRLRPPVPPEFKAAPPALEHEWNTEARLGDFVRQTLAADVADLETALAVRNTPKAQAERIVQQYRVARRSMMDYALAYSEWKSWPESRAKPVPELFMHPAPDGLPAEFRDYLSGAYLYYWDDPAQARLTWLHLLQLDKSERHWRSTWAAFMIGRSLVETDPEKAVGWLRLVRRFAREGFADSLALASSSLGWEARACLNMKPPRCAEAIELYVAQMSTGEATAVPSLQRAAAKALTTSDGDLARVAANVTARRVVTAYLISRGGPWMDSPAPDAQRKWLAAFEEAKAGLAEEADRFALAAYQAGEMDVAKRWLKLAPQDAPMTRWVRAKLLLRDGKLAEAAEHLAFVARRLPEAKACKQVCKYSDEIYRRSEKYYDPAYETYLAGVPQERLRGELGSLLLSRGQYGEALGTLLAGGFWLDAAYVAECVMTPDELQAFVDANCPPPGSSWEGPSENGGTDIPVCPITDRQECLSHHAMVKDVSWGRVAAAKPGDDPAWYRGPLRHLLARRLARLGRFDEARAYYPAKLQPRLDAYVEALREGNDARVAKEKRAEALWQAACVARRDGMSLLGTELAPDAFIHDGSYECVEQRNPQGDPARSRLVPASADEIERARRHRVEPFVRFHYRYVAADLAWRAAALMPAESDETARVLCEAGSWLKKRDPKAADRFYKALVRRCGTTSLGRQADALRWFPLLAPPVAARAE